MFKRILVLAAGVLACLAGCGEANAQQRDAPKVEIGGQFTTLELRAPDFFFPPSSSEAGVGGRVGYNVTDYFGVEAELNFLPRRASLGGMRQGQFGVKAGKRWRKFGLFAKARPGFVSFSEVFTDVGSNILTGSNGQQFVFPIYEFRRRTVFSMDVGGVVEFYPARNLLMRVDVGDTLIRYRPQDVRTDFNGTFRNMPSGVRHNLQVTTGVAYRFLNPKGADEAEPPAPARGTPRFEAGIQYTTLILNLPTTVGFPGFGPLGRPLVAESAVGGRLTFNLNDHVALEGAVDFLPRGDTFQNRTTADGNGVQGQFGVKAGRRFHRVGLFGKVRPGFLSFSRVNRLVGTRVVNFGPQTFTFGVFRPERKTYFETDVGGVVEFYPSRRIVTRFDVGDTIIRYRDRVSEGFTFSMAILPQPDDTRHNFQFSAGVGFRF